MKIVPLSILFLALVMQSCFAQSQDPLKKDTVRYVANAIHLQRPETKQFDDQIEFEITACRSNPREHLITVDFYLYTEKVDQKITMGSNFLDITNDYFAKDDLLHPLQAVSMSLGDVTSTRIFDVKLPTRTRIKGSISFSGGPTPELYWVYIYFKSRNFDNGKDKKSGKVRLRQVPVGRQWQY